MNIQYPVLKRNGNLQYGNYPTKLILHHPEFYGTPEALNDMMINMGFVMCGYNFYVRKDGSVHAMRPVDAIGGNCYGQNACSIGLSFEGNFMVDTMSDAQFNAGVELCKYLMQQYPNVKEIGPHKKYFNTDCPGTNFPVDRMIQAVMGGGSSTTPATPSEPAQQNCYGLWDSGDQVKAIQEKLIKLGYDLGKWGADACFGQMTYNAVEAFQASKGLKVDGLVGPCTILALDKAITAMNAIDVHSVKYLQHELNVQCGAGLSEDNIPGPATLAACILVKRGAEGNITRWIQSKLGISADGIFGYNTFVAVQNFQAAYGLDADGIVGKNTWRALLGL